MKTTVNKIHMNLKINHNKPLKLLFPVFLYKGICRITCFSELILHLQKTLYPWTTLFLYFQKDILTT